MLLVYKPNRFGGFDDFEMGFESGGAGFVVDSSANTLTNLMFNFLFLKLFGFSFAFLGYSGAVVGSIFSSLLSS